MSSSSSNNNPSSELKSSLGHILIDSNNPSTEKDLKLLIYNHQSSDTDLNYILNEISQDTRKFILISYFVQAIIDFSLSLNIFNDIYTILQGYVNQRNFNDILNVFDDISKGFSNSHNGHKGNTHIDTAIGFCVFNLKETDTIFQRLGSLCLIKLISNITLNKSLIKNLFKTVIEFIEAEAFKAHCELLSVLDVLILQANKMYCPYATVTLYKALDFLTESNAAVRTLALKVIYNLVLYCNVEIFELKLQIIEFVNVLKGDPNEDVREMSGNILKIINKPLKGSSNEDIAIEANKQSVLLNEVLLSEDKGEQHKEQLMDKGYMIQNKDKDNKRNTNEGYWKGLSKKKGNVKQIKSNLFKSNNTNDNAHSKSQGYTYHDDQNNDKLIINDDGDKPDKDKKINDNDNNKDYQITELLRQMKEMSDKQVKLIDIITTLKQTSQEQIARLNQRITALESFISNNIPNRPQSKSHMKNTSKELHSPMDFNTALSNALLSSDTEFISVIESISSQGKINEDLSKIKHSVIDECIERSTTILTKKCFIHSIVVFLKLILMSITFQLKKTTIRNLTNVLLYVQSIKDNSNEDENDLSDEDVIDITLLISYLNTLTSP